MTDEVWTTRQILQWIESYLAKHGDNAPRSSAQWLVSEALGCDRMHLFLDLERPLSTDERAALRDFTRRRAQGEPLQYITGHAPFRYLSLEVAGGVLIPRPETEVLMSCALALLPPAPKPQEALDEALALTFAAHNGNDEDAETARAEAAQSAHTPLLVADIGTGSGCIACALASEHAGVHVIATDLAPEAVTLSQRNVAALGLSNRVEVVQCDLGEGIPPEQMGSFDLIVSNPPYIPTHILKTLPHEVADFEPTLALDGGIDGLDIFRRLLTFCTRALKPKGAFACELHETSLDAAQQLAEAAGFYECAITCDLAGKPRILSGRKPA